MSEGVLSESFVYLTGQRGTPEGRLSGMCLLLGLRRFRNCVQPVLRTLHMHRGTPCLKHMCLYTRLYARRRRE